MKKFYPIFFFVVAFSFLSGCKDGRDDKHDVISSFDLIYRIDSPKLLSESGGCLEYIAGLGATAVQLPPMRFKGKGYDIDGFFVQNADSLGLKIILNIDVGCGSHISGGTLSNDLVSEQNDLYGIETENNPSYLPAEEMDSLKIWCENLIEMSGADGVYFSGYPFSDKKTLASLNSSLRKSYPGLFIIGEIASENVAQIAYWQDGHKNRDGFDSKLSCLMDFRLFEALSKAVNVDREVRGNGISRVFSILADDIYLDNPESLIIFSGISDKKSIAAICKGDQRKKKMILTMIATLRGIPQIFEGDEIMGDDDQTYCRELFRWRKTSKAVCCGKTIHFNSSQNTYAYFRYVEDDIVFVFVNNSENSCNIPWGNYSKFTSSRQGVWKDALSGIEINPAVFFVPAKGTAIFEFTPAH